MSVRLLSVTEVLTGLVNAPSVNPSLAPSEGTGEAAVAEFACGWLEAHGVSAWKEDAAPGRPNVVARINGGDGPTLVLCAHLDTVGTAGMTIPPFEARVEGDRLYGRGAYDMKGSAAAIMVAIATLAAQKPGGCVMAALVADEEYASLGAFDFVRRHRADACIVTEPAEGDLVLAHKGFVWAEIVATGRAARLLLQQGKGGDIASAFGGGASQTAFGARAGATVLSRATTVCAVLFMLGALMLGVIGQRGPGSVVGGSRPASRPPQQSKPVPTEQQSVPVKPPDPQPEQPK